MTREEMLAKLGITEEDFKPQDNEGFVLDMLADHELRVCELELGINESEVE